MVDTYAKLRICREKNGMVRAAKSRMFQRALRRRSFYVNQNYYILRGDILSTCIFIAADVHLEEIKNPHYKQLSINEALSLGIEMDLKFLKGIDKDAPNTILWTDTELTIDNGRLFDGDLADNFALLTMDHTLHYCSKPFGVYIEWHYFTEERAKKIIQYIHNVLLKTDCVELWNVWLSDYDPPEIKTSTVNIQGLQPIHIQQIAELNPWGNGSIISTPGCDTPIHHCLRITV